MRSLLFLLLTLPCAAYCQHLPIDTFYTPGTTWTQLFTCTTFDRGADVLWDQGAVFKIERDTFVAGTRYHLLSVRAKGSDNFDIYTLSYSVWPAAPTATIIGRIRVDGSKVYFTDDRSISASGYHCIDIGKEYLLYDFNLGIGSSVPNDTLSTGITVSTIDSVRLSNGMYANRYIQGSNKVWIEGVGGMDGLMSYWAIQYCFVDPSDDGEYLLCYDNPAFSYHPPASTAHFHLSRDTILAANCFEVDSIHELLPGVLVPSTGVQSRNMTIYPNPLTEGTLYVDIPAIQQTRKVEIFDVTGRSIYSSDVVYGNHLKLDVALDKGVYWVTARLADNSSLTRKLVKL